jgi:hypothetical protein
MRRIRIEKLKLRRERSWLEVLPSIRETPTSSEPRPSTVPSTGSHPITVCARIKEEN